MPHGDSRAGGLRPPSADGQRQRFFQDPTLEFEFLIALGRAYYMSGSIGKLLYLAGQIQDGDPESAFQAFKRAGDEARAQAEDCEKRGHRVSARQAYMWAAGYYSSSTYFVDASPDPDRFLPTWETSYACWEKALPLFDPPVERVQIPYEKTALRGCFFRVDDSGRRRPLLILNNGSDGAAHDLWVQGGAGAVARGYNCLIFDGPGQGYALWKQKLYFRPDWEKVITPVVDYALTRPEVDPKRIALQGVSQGGYWVPRAVAFEHRIAAAIADPGVTAVATSWLDHLPQPMLDLLQSGQKETFNQEMSEGSPDLKAMLRFRMRPYGLSSPYDVFKAMNAYSLKNVAGKIRCPMLITDPEGEQFWPGQSQALYEMLTCPKTLVRFTAEEGADVHCEPKAPGLRDLRVFDWLDETLGQQSDPR
jgi:Prolyl oligopeptidase family